MTGLNKAPFGLRDGLVFPVLFAFLIISGCAVSDFFSQRYENSVAYFNTYYNASRLYDEAVLEIETTEKSQRSKELPPQKEISPAARQKLTTVIEKCSKLLLYHPDSKWIEDALLLIGKSYYYQGEYSKAQRKFAELIAEFQNSKKIFEARLWLGKSFRRNNESEQAIRELRAVADAALAESENPTAAEALLSLGDIYSERNSFEDAIASYQDLIDRTDYDELKSQAEFRIGELYEAKDDYAKATASFKKVLELKPDYHLSYLAQSHMATDAMKMDRYDEALQILYGLLGDRGNLSFYPQIKLDIANALKGKGELRSAIDAYHIIDTSYARTDAAAKGYYQLGLIYEKERHRYAAAETNYVRARSEFPPSAIVPLATRRAENLRKYFTYRQALLQFDSLLVYQYKSLSKAVDSSHSQRLQTSHDSLTSRVDSLKQNETPQSTSDTLKMEHKDTLSKSLAIDAGSILKNELKRKDADSVYTQPKDTLSDSTASRADTVRVLHFEVWERSERTPVIDNLKLQLAQKTHELTTLFFLDLEEPDSALFWCKKTVTLSPDSELSSRAVYTLAEIYRSRNPDDHATVDSVYRTIVSQYPGTKYAIEVQRLLGLQVTDKGDDPATRTYHDAEKLLREKRNEEAITLLHKVVSDYPQSEYGAKSQYAIGWIYENVEGHLDSAEANYKVLAKLFPSSNYTFLVRPKLAEAALQEAQEKAKRDSLAKTLEVPPAQIPSTEQKIMTAPVDTTAKQPNQDDEVTKRAKKPVDERMKQLRKAKTDSTKVMKD